MKQMENEKIRRTAKDMALQVKVAEVLLNDADDRAGELLIEYLIEELQKLRPQTERAQAKETPCNERCEDSSGARTERATPYVDFGAAIRAAKDGHRIARRGWNGKNQYVVLATNISFVDPDGRVINPEHREIGNKALAFVGTSGVQLGWLASQADMLAEDWIVLGGD